MTRVLHVITGLEHGGAERQLALLLRHLPVVCEVATLTRTGTLGAQIRRTGVPVHEIGMRGNRDLAALPRLARLIRRGRYDVVHTHLYRACVYGRIAARMAGTPRIIATEHSLGDGHMEGRPTTRGVRALYRATERLGTATVAVSPTVAARLRAWGVPPGRITVIPNGIDAAAFAFDAARRAATRRRLGIGPDEPIVGAVGRLVPTKRFDLLIEAVARLAGVRLLLAGAGPMRGTLERHAHDLGAGGRVIFAGGTSDVPGVLAAMDVLAAPSVQETFGLGVLEALAAGLPVRYTTCPALDDLPPAETAIPLAETAVSLAEAAILPGEAAILPGEAAILPGEAAILPGEAAAPPGDAALRDGEAAALDARRLPTDIGIWAAELGRVLRTPRDRTRVPSVVARYAIAEQAARLARLYRAEPPARAVIPTRERAHDAAT